MKTNISMSYIGALLAIVLIGWGQAWSLRNDLADSHLVVQEYRRLSADLLSTNKALLHRVEQTQKRADQLTEWVIAHDPRLTWERGLEDRILKLEHSTK